MSGRNKDNKDNKKQSEDFPVPPFTFDTETGDTEENDLVHTPLTDEVNPSYDNEEDKERNSSDEDFVTFDVDRVEDLEKNKENYDENDTND